MDPSQPVKHGRGRPKGQKNPKNVGRRYKNGDPPIQCRNHVNAGMFQFFPSLNCGFMLIKYYSNYFQRNDTDTECPSHTFPIGRKLSDRIVTAGRNR